MNRTHASASSAFSPQRRPLIAGLAVFLAVAFSGSAARGQEAPGDPDGGTTAPRDWDYSSRGPERTPGQSSGRQWWETGPWFIVPSLGGGWFDGDGMSDSPAFIAQLQVARELSGEAYLFGSYLFALPETDGDDASPGGGIDNETHDLHAFTLGAGLRGQINPDFRLFLEPHGGVLFGSDIDAAGVFALAAGVDLVVTEGVSVRFAVTGLLTGADIDTGGADAELESGIIGTFGVSFEF